MRRRLRLIGVQRHTRAALEAQVDHDTDECPTTQTPGGHPDWYRALVELDSPESVMHAAAILNHLAVYHSATIRPVAGQPIVSIVVRAQNISHACRISISLVQASGYRPVRVDVTDLLRR